MNKKMHNNQDKNELDRVNSNLDQDLNNDQNQFEEESEYSDDLYSEDYDTERDYQQYKTRAGRFADRGVYLLPNLFTIGALFAGFYGIVAATKGLFEIAAIALFIAMLLDNLDGRVARMTKTQSKLGAELDSLSDMVAFGVAPALIVYHWSLIGLGKIGWLLSFFYTATAALRLARFNSQLDVADKKYFKGLPAPVAAAVVVGFVWNCVDLEIVGQTAVMKVLIGVITALVGALMVSTLKYYSFKTIDFRGKVHYLWILSMVLLLIVIVLEPAKVLFSGCLIYALSGFYTTYHEYQKTKDRITK